ncbi:hypothetical protein BC628DRAFT_1096597 [Trametes gibbosa]|nr:hypothetical protein BC628DRAFT_1096597 [Trametes gibbosa]
MHTNSQEYRSTRYPDDGRSTLTSPNPIQPNPPRTRPSAARLLRKYLSPHGRTHAPSQRKDTSRTAAPPAPSGRVGHAPRTTHHTSPRRPISPSGPHGSGQGQSRDPPTAKPFNVHPRPRPTSSAGMGRRSTTRTGQAWMNRTVKRVRAPVRIPPNTTTSTSTSTALGMSAPPTPPSPYAHRARSADGRPLELQPVTSHLCPPHPPRLATSDRPVRARGTPASARLGVWD